MKTALATIAFALLSCATFSSLVADPTSTPAPTSTPQGTATPRILPTPTALPESVLIDIPPRPYYGGNLDFCGEVVLEEALAYYGKQVPQLEINHLGGGDGHVGLHFNEILRALASLNVDFDSWGLHITGERGYDTYIQKLKRILADGHPILAGVKVNPTRHPEWSADHFILLVGYDAQSFIYNMPDSRSSRTFEEFQFGDPGTGHGLTFSNPYDYYSGIEFKGAAAP